MREKNLHDVYHQSKGLCSVLQSSQVHRLEIRRIFPARTAVSRCLHFKYGHCAMFAFGHLATNCPVCRLRSSGVKQSRTRCGAAASSSVGMILLPATPNLCGDQIVTAIGGVRIHAEVYGDTVDEQQLPMQVLIKRWQVKWLLLWEQVSVLPGSHQCDSAGLHRRQGLPHPGLPQGVLCLLCLLSCVARGWMECERYQNEVGWRLLWKTKP